MTEKIPCTIAILTKNSATTLPRALESVREFADIVVCDGGSTDATHAIAAEHGARIIAQDTTYLRPDGYIRDFSGVRNQTLEAAREPWFFFLDSDEYLSSEIVDEMRHVISQGSKGAYWVPRKYVLHGKVIDCATTYPNYSMRFFAKSSVERFIKEVHERIKVKDGVEPGHLLHALLVPVDPVMRNSWAKDRRYIAIEVVRSRERTTLDLLRGSLHTWGVSGLYLIRLIRCLLFCRGTRMPILLELDRHWYHVKLEWAIWRDRIGRMFA